MALPFLVEAQDRGLTLRFDSISLKDAILQLEDRSGLTFYFEEAWLEGEEVIKRYSDTKVDDVLSDLLSGTSINYYRSENEVILLMNNAIVTDLPDGYFDLNSTPSDSARTPFFREQYLEPNSDQERQLVVIGKQNLEESASTFRLSGRATNLASGEAIQDLVIYTADRSRYGVTDSLGYYSLELPKGLHAIETDLLGFEKIIQPVLIHGDGKLDLVIPEEVELLDEVVVRSSRDANVRDAIVGAATIDVESIKTIPLVLGERDVLQVATTLPGISRVGEGANGLNVRGGRSDQNLVLLDDAVLYNPAHFLGLFSAINPFTTESLNIYKASIPAEFGGRLSSVFDLRSKTGQKDEFAGEGSIGPMTGNLSVEVPVVKGVSSLLAGVRATYAGYILKNLRSSSLRESGASFYDAILKYSHDLNANNTIEGTFYYSQDRLNLSADSTFSYSNRLASLRWTHSFSKKSWASLIVAASQYRYDIGFEGEANRNFEFDYQLNERFVKIRAESLLGRGHTLSYGLSSKLYGTEPGNIRPLGPESDIQAKSVDSERGLESAVYVSNLFELGNKWLFDLGLRYSFFAALGAATQNVYAPGVPRNESSILEVLDFGKNDVIRTYDGLEYRFSARYLLGKDLSLKAGVNRTMQYIHLLTTNTTQSPTDIWKLSDLNVKPQTAHQFSFGIFKNILEKDLELSLEGYYKRMQDLLDYKIGAQLILNEELETELLQGEGRAYGGELLIKKISGRFNGHLGYSYARAKIRLNSTLREEQVNNGEFFPANFDRPHDLSLILNYRFTKRISVSANFIYQTGRPITYPVGKFIFANEEQVLYSDRNQFRIPDYHRVDIGINIEGSHKKKKLAHSFVNISIYNLLGRNNPYSVFFVNQKGRIRAFKTTVFSVPVPTITYNFKF